MVFHLLRRSRNENITEIKARSFSWCLFTRLHPARKLCSSPLAHMTQRRVCSEASLSETRSIPDHFMWGDPLPGLFCIIHRNLLLQHASSLFQTLYSWVSEKKARERNNKEDLALPCFFLSLTHFFHSSPATVSLKQASFIPPCSTKLLHANKQVRCITETRI